MSWGVGARDAGGVVTGTTDPAVLAELARGTLRKKLPPCARRCRPVQRHHALLVGQALEHFDYLDEMVGRSARRSRSGSALLPRRSRSSRRSRGE